MIDIWGWLMFDICLSGIKFFLSFLWCYSYCMCKIGNGVF